MASRSGMKVLALGAFSLVILLSLLLMMQAGPFGAGSTANAQGEEELIGTFQIGEGKCEPKGPVTSGSYFQMTDGDGNFLINGSSPCDPTITPLRPGTQGGLVTGVFQPHADPACEPISGDALSNRINAPQRFFGTLFGAATEAEVIPGSPPIAAVPTIIHDGAGNLTGDLSAFSICWSKLFFAQGYPRPEGLPPVPGTGQENACPEPQRKGLPPEPISGTFDSSTGAYTLDWASRIGGSFGCTFTGFWHLQGTFTTEPVTVAPVVGGEPPVPDKLLPILLVTAVGLIAAGAGGFTLAYARWPRRRQG